MADYTPSKKDSKKDFDDILEEVARKVRKNSEIDKLGKKLGFQPDDIQGYIETNHKTHQITTDGTLQMLREWRKLQTESTERSALKTALKEAKQIHLADDLFPSNMSERTVMDKGQMEGPSSSASNVTSSSSSGRMVTDKELMNLASCLHSNYYIPVAINLGIPYAVYDNIMRENVLSLQTANFQMLMKWRVKENGGRVKDLDKALRDADCGGLQYKEN